MLSNEVLLVLLIISLVAIMGVVLWRSIYSIKHKGDEKALNALTKAQAASSWTSWMWIILWGGSATFIFKTGTVFTMNNIGIFIVILIGMQCIVELLAGYYYTKMTNA